MSPAAAKVLVVDDDPGILDTLTDVLAASGYDAVMAASGREAIEKARATAFDLILMDIQMPDLNGVQTLHALRMADPRVAVIMMTAYTRDELVAESERMTGFGVLSKPLDLERLLPLVERIVSPRRSGGTTPA
jgi:DNA-binding NtrC family response regulator